MDAKTLESFISYIKKYYSELPLDEYKLPADLEMRFREETKSPHKIKISTIQAIVIDMEHHMKINKNQSIVTLDKRGTTNQNKAGYIEHIDNCITIIDDLTYSLDNFLYIIVHELSHEYQQFQNYPLISSSQIVLELFTDALLFFLGFGKFIKNGKKTLFGSQLGYLEEKYFKQLEKESDIMSKKKVTKDVENEVLNDLRKIVKQNIEGLEATLRLIRTRIDDLLSRAPSPAQLTYVNNLKDFIFKGNFDLLLEVTKKDIMVMNSKELSSRNSKLEEVFSDLMAEYKKVLKRFGFDDQ